MAQSGFKLINDPLKAKDPSRNQVNVPTQSFAGYGDRNQVNKGVKATNPESYFSSGLESRQWSSPQYRPQDRVLGKHVGAGPERNCNVPPQGKVNFSSGYHSHMKTPSGNRSHGFAGRRK